jgi:hypothetical protein
MDIPFTITPLALIRLLKGASLSCLTVLLLCREPVQAAWLCRATGYSAHSVTEALRLLEDLSLAAHDSHRSAWQLLPSARQALVASYQEPGEPDEPALQELVQEDFTLEGRLPLVGGQIAVRDPESPDEMPPAIRGPRKMDSVGAVPNVGARRRHEHTMYEVSASRALFLDSAYEISNMDWILDRIANHALREPALEEHLPLVGGPEDRGHPGQPCLGSVQEPVSAGRRRNRSRSRRGRGT